jgi:hypothetical protein
MGFVADNQTFRGYINPAFGHTSHFTEQDRRIKYYAIPQNADSSLLDDSGWQEMKLEDFISDCDSMTGIIAAAETGDHRAGSC